MPIVVPNKAMADATARSMAVKAVVRKATPAELADQRNTFIGYIPDEDRRMGYVLELPQQEAPPATVNATAMTGAKPAEAAQPAPAVAKKPRGVLAKKAQAEEAARAEYFTPGNIIQGYGGQFDRVLEYTPAGASGNWSVKVQHVIKKDGAWVVDPKDDRVRVHATQPSTKELAQGRQGRWPVEDAPAAAGKPDKPATQAAEALQQHLQAQKARIEKAIRYELPPEKGAEGDESWLGARSPSFKPTSRQQLLMDAVEKALDDGAFHNTDINEHVAKTLGVTTEQRARNSLNVQGGDFGYDVYNARHAVEAQRGNAKSRELAKELNLKPGDVLGTLVFNDGKVTTGARVVSIKEDGLIVTITGKRGSSTLNGEVGVDNLVAAVDRAKERGKRKDGYAEFVAGRAALQQSAQKPTKKKPIADQTRAKADLMAALADLGDILGKNTRMNIMPEQEQKLLPVLTRVLDAAFRLGYHKFKDAAKFALDQIRTHLGDDAADALTLQHLQGAYVAMSGSYLSRGAQSIGDVAAVRSLGELLGPTDAGVEPGTTEVQPDGFAADAQGSTKSGARARR